LVIGREVKSIAKKTLFWLRKLPHD
jgi:hypothetical protein